MKGKILIIEDNEKLAMTLTEGLRENEYDCQFVTRGDTGFEVATAEKFDLIILDVLLPGYDGFTIIDKLRSQNNMTPVLMLTAMSTSEDVLKGFSYGADDYLTKPFDFEILLARIKAVLKRTTKLPELNSFGSLQLDLGNNIVIRDGVKIELTPGEFTLFRYMLQNEGKTLSRAQLMLGAWHSKSTDTNQIDVYIKYLRNKIDNDFEHKIIQTVRGWGYAVVTDKNSGIN